MGERLRTSGVPGWAWGIIFTLFLTLASFGVGAIAGNQQMKSDIITNSTDIADHEAAVLTELDKKATKEQVEALEKENDRVYETVLRIELMLTDHVKHD